MSKSKYTRAQMIAALKQVEAGRRSETWPARRASRIHDPESGKAKFGGMDGAEAQEALYMRDENSP